MYFLVSYLDDNPDASSLLLLLLFLFSKQWKNNKNKESAFIHTHIHTNIYSVLTLCFLYDCKINKMVIN